ncbi:MAG: lytic murein transglycosylase B [Rhodocyclales bacterium]|nr:lytic murein transglycosylase B [Rhodocyclales bacterium]
MTRTYHSAFHRLRASIVPMVCLLIVGLALPIDAVAKTKAKKAPVEAKQPLMSSNPDVQQFIADMQERHGFDSASLTTLFDQQRPDNRVVRIMAPAPAQLTPNWAAYRSRFVNQRRINRGIDFWDTYSDQLTRAEKQFGVPAEIIVAIIGVETEYGRNMGSFSVLNALATIGFYGERRREFFQSELEQYLLLARENQLDLANTKGSFAGAMGIPQFMPSSQRRWGVDFDGDGRIDLRQSPTDAIGSVGNFLKSHGWQTGQVAVIPAIAPNPLPSTFEKVDIKPGISLEAYQKAGFTFSSTLRDDTLATLVSLSTPNQATDYWLGLQNYYVITRYNRSAAYAMSVIDLGTAIREARGTQTHAPLARNDSE